VQSVAHGFTLIRGPALHVVAQRAGNLHARAARGPRASPAKTLETLAPQAVLRLTVRVARRLRKSAQRVSNNHFLGGGNMKALMTRLWRSEEGQDLAEYALLIALIALVVIAAVTALGGQIQTVFNNIANALNP